MHDTLTPPLGPETGRAMHELMATLYPICRSITGDGVRATLRLLQAQIPLTLHEVPSGTQVLDWTVPQEWNIRDAYIKDERGHKVVDFQQCNLHVLNYSTPVRERLSLAALRPHLFSLPEQPTAIPYRTSYYHASWGFCLADDVLATFADGEYEVVIDSTLSDGALTYGELILPGASEEEVLFSTHCCHPSLANDNLSGLVLSTFLAKALGQQAQRRYTYRFLFVPGTIGSITWLAQHRAAANRIRHGLVIACVGDGGSMSYKRSRRGTLEIQAAETAAAQIDTAEIDRAVQQVLIERGQPHEIVDFSPYGYDERQYCSPGFNLAVGSLTRTPHGQFPEYHTSLDNLDFVQPAALVDSLETYLQVVGVLEQNRRYRNLQPYGEPQLGRRGLYGAFGGQRDQQAREMAMLWVLNFSDGEHDLLAIAERACLPFTLVVEVAQTLAEHGLLEALPVVDG